MPRNNELERYKRKAQEYHREVCLPKGCELLLRGVQGYSCGALKKPKQVIVDFEGFECNKAIIKGVPATIRLINN